MSMPAPHLDDRRFQDLVDDAKRLVQRRCPEWTDHNVSDPGVTLIEAFAFMVDQLLYRLNRVPERNYVKFLELIGVRLFPPTAARVAVTFWLTSPKDEDVVIPPDTEVSTRRTNALDPVSFATIEPLTVKSVALARVASTIQPGEVRDHTLALESSQPFFCFDRVPKPDDALLIGLTAAAPNNALRLLLDCQIEGVGVDPRDPPNVWEAHTGDEWVRCELDTDTTGGLNRAGEVILHLPASHAPSVFDGHSAGWVRCRIVPHEEYQPAYSASPRIVSVHAETIGGTTEAINAELVRNEVVGDSDGVSHQEFRLRNAPVVRGPEALVLEVSDEEEGWQEWTRVETFSAATADSRVFTLDETTGILRLGPSVVEPDGTIRQYGAFPAKGAIIRVPSYRTGGGARGTVARGSISVLQSSLPDVASIENRTPASGGVDGETVDAAKLRGPILLRTRDRAVTTEDFESLAREAAPEVARVSAAAAGDGAEPGCVRVYVVPTVGEDEMGRIEFPDLSPNPELLDRIASFLDARRLLGTRVSVEPPQYLGVTVVASIRARPKADPMRLEQACLQALFRYFHPITGGPDRDGWPFGRPVAQGEVFSVLQHVRGVEMVEGVRVFASNPTTGEKGAPVERIPLGRHVLPFSFEHQIRVLASTET